MKKILLPLLFMSTLTICNSQSLLDIYKSGSVNLVPDKEYGNNNDWNEIFSGYYDNIQGTQTGHEKKIALSEDGRIFMSHKNHHEIWAFDNSGKLTNKIGEQGGKTHQFPMIPSIETVYGNSFFVTTDVHGRIKLFDLDGKLFKAVKLDFMVRRAVALDKNNLLLSGWVIWRNKGTRHIVARLNLDTEEYEIIYSAFTNPKINIRNEIFLAGGDTVRFAKSEIGLKSIKLPASYYFNKERIFILSTGGFVVANPQTQKMDYYSPDGKLINSFEYDSDLIAVTQEDVDKHYENLKKSIASTTEKVMNHPAWSEEKKKEWVIFYENYMKEDLGKYSDISYYHPYLPVFSTILLDDEDNMLVFKFTRNEDKDNLFSVIAYNRDGTKIADASLHSDEYDLKITDKTIIFKDGYIYAVCEKKNAAGIPLRLVKFKITPGR